jgi:DNA-binding NarL/FixJ family response regulator
MGRACRQRAPGLRADRTRGSGQALSAREREIATLAASGLTNKQIGEQLILSPRTVGDHLHKIFPKLGITTRAALRDALEELPSASGKNPDTCNHMHHEYNQVVPDN